MLATADVLLFPLVTVWFVLAVPAAAADDELLPGWTRISVRGPALPAASELHASPAEIHAGNQ
jgi:hypothetical protein